MMAFILTPVKEPDQYGQMFSPLEYTWEPVGIPKVASAKGGNVRLDFTASEVAEFVANGNRAFLNAPAVGIKGIYPIIEAGETYIVLDLSYNSVGAVTINVSIAKTQRFTLRGGYSNNIVSGVESVFPEKPMKVIASFDIEPNPITGQYTFEVGYLLQSHNKTKEPPQIGMSENLNLQYFIQYPGSLWGRTVYFTSLNRVAYYGNSESMADYLRPATVLHEHGAINFKGSDGLSRPVLFSTVNQQYQCLNNEVIKPSTYVQNIYYKMTALSGSCYEITFDSLGFVNSTAFTIHEQPDWITLEIIDSGTVKVKVCPPFNREVKGDFNQKDWFDPDWFTSESAKGDYIFEILDDQGSTVFELELSVIESREVVTLEDCYEYNLAWWNPQGGWSSFIFTGSKEYGYFIDGEKTYKDNGTIRTGEVEGVYPSVQVSSGLISQRSARFLQYLRISPVAYLYNTKTEEWDIPVHIEKKDFAFDRDRYRESESAISFTLRHAKEINVQTT